MASAVLAVSFVSAAEASEDAEAAEDVEDVEVVEAAAVVADAAADPAIYMERPKKCPCKSICGGFSMQSFCI